MVVVKEKEKEKPMAPWAIAGAVVLFVAIVAYLLPKHSASDQLAAKANRLAAIDQIRRALAAISEAQNSAVMAGSEKDARTFVDQAQAASTELDRELTQLKHGLTTHGDRQELELMSRVEQALQEFQRLDKQLLDLAVQNTNRKAFQLAVGPAAKRVQEMDAALSRIISDRTDPKAEDNLQILRLVSDTRISVLRIQLLLLPHIAEESNQKMDELEAEMAHENQRVRQNLESLKALLPTSEASDLAEAESRYAEFDKLQPEIIRLSRENTNVRSVSIAMSQKREAMLTVQDALASLEHAIEAEEIVGR